MPRGGTRARSVRVASDRREGFFAGEEFFVRRVEFKPRFLIGAVAALVVLVALPPASGAAATIRDAKFQDDQSRGRLVRTREGPVRGFVKDGVSTFLGIPYAAPPVGRLRWRPPARPARWRRPLDATEYGPTCAQVTTFAVFAGPASVSEDCLHLNVFTRGARRARARPRPVLVWIHGGGNVTGASDHYDGSKLARGGRHGGSDTVVVTVNYRLGLLGFLAHPSLAGEGDRAVNYGIMDIQAALRWVRRNISAFGGDPDRVTLGGQSAGATDVAANVISPRSARLFHRAIFQSPNASPTSPTSTLTPLASALMRGRGFADAAGCPGEDAGAAACLRALSVPEILQLQGTANANGPFVTGPTVDGTVIPITPERAWTSGRFNRVPIMGGNTRDEQNFFIGLTEYFSGPPQAPMTAADYVEHVTTIYSGNAGPGGSPPAYPAGTVGRVLAEYPLANYETPQLADNAAFSDVAACRSRHVHALMSGRVPVYTYRFDYRDAPYYFPRMPGFVPLAAHTIDIQFLFPRWHGGSLGVAHSLDREETRLSDELVAAWTNFARTGNPNGRGDSPWPRHVGDNGRYLSQSVPRSSTFTDAEFSESHHCDFWDDILVYESSP